MELNSGNGGWIALLGVVVPLLIAFVTSRYADRSAKRSADVQEKAVENETANGTFQQNMDLEKYIQDRVDRAVEKATEEMLLRMGNLEKAFGGVLGELKRLREGFREYIRKVVTGWGKEPEPPILEQHILDSLSEDDIMGTLTPLQAWQFTHPESNNKESK